MKIAQRITATMPLWEQVRMIVQNTVTPFLLRVGGEYQSVVPQFRMPFENPLCDVGAGWHMVSTEPGRELAVRRCPLMHHDVVAAGGHPYFYAVSGRPHPESSLWTVSVVTPHQADFAFPDVDLWDYIPQLDHDEEQHEEGFVLRSN